MASLEKIDLFKLNKAEYVTPKKPVLVETQAATYLSIAGVGAPGGETFTIRIGALYGVAFTVKMTRKFGGQQDYAVGRLEAQWWTDGGGANFAQAPKDQWCWQLLIRTPDFVSPAEISRAVEKLLAKGKDPAARAVELKNLSEGRCVQMLHVGPYEREAETIEQMRAFAADKGLAFHGRHHEIYISDPRRVAPEKLKTILRMPVAELRPK